MDKKKLYGEFRENYIEKLIIKERSKNGSIDCHVQISVGIF